MKDQHTATAVFDRRATYMGQPGVWCLYYRGSGLYVQAGSRKEAEDMLPEYVSDERARLATSKKEFHSRCTEALSRTPGRWEGVGPDVFRHIRRTMKKRGMRIVQRPDGRHYLEYAETCLA